MVADSGWHSFTPLVAFNDPAAVWAAQPTFFVAEVLFFFLAVCGITDGTVAYIPCMSEYVILAPDAWMPDADSNFGLGVVGTTPFIDRESDEWVAMTTSWQGLDPTVGKYQNLSHCLPPMGPGNEQWSWTAFNCKSQRGR